MKSMGEVIMSSRPLLIIVGPTAIGKTALSLELAQKYQGEIISADSRLLYQGLDIGTAKPSLAQRHRVNHHLIDICQPDETLSLGQYKRLANRTIDQLHQRARLPILVGGTGQYVRAIVEGWSIPEVSPNKRLRKALGALQGQELYRWLRVLDPLAAEKIDPRNVRRVVRALEVIFTTGQLMSELQRKQPPDYALKTIGLTCEREFLYQRIDERVDQMEANGLLVEVEALREAGYSRRLPAMSGLGYRQLWSHLESELSYEEAVERIKFETHRFARQQYTWFRLDDPSIQWFNIQQPGWQGAAEKLVREWLDRL